jgi:hypothetical protein
MMMLGFQTGGADDYRLVRQHRIFKIVLERCRGWKSRSITSLAVTNSERLPALEMLLPNHSLSIPE